MPLFNYFPVSNPGNSDWEDGRQEKTEIATIPFWLKFLKEQLSLREMTKSRLQRNNVNSLSMHLENEINRFSGI